MRTLLFALLVAGAAGPALAAAAQDADERPTFRSERASRAEARAERQAERVSEPRPTRSERPQRNVEPAHESAGSDRRPDVQRDAPARPARTDPASASVQPSRGFEPRAFETPGERAQRRVAGDTVREWRARERLGERPDSPTLVQERNLRRRSTGEVGTITGRSVVPTIIEGLGVAGRGVRPAVIEAPGSDLVQPRTPLPRTMDPQRLRVSETPEFGAEPPAPATALTGVTRPEHRWRRDWRTDGSYDWRDWRRRNRSLFHLGFYYDPFGWNYFRYSIGWRMWPSYYRSSFWLSDPWAYRLPRSYGPYRWIRYHGDALLVNLYTGEVVDVVYDFFW